MVFYRFAICTISACEMAYFRGRNAPYHTLIWAFSEREMGNIRKQNVSFRTTLWGIPKYGSG